MLLHVANVQELYSKRLILGRLFLVLERSKNFSILQIFLEGNCYDAGDLYAELKALNKLGLSQARDNRALTLKKYGRIGKHVLNRQILRLSVFQNCVALNAFETQRLVCAVCRLRRLS